MLAAGLGGVDGWGVVGGRAVDLHLGPVTRDHADLEIAIAAERFGLVAAALADLAWDVVGAGRLWPYPDALDALCPPTGRTGRRGTDCGT